MLAEKDIPHKKPDEKILVYVHPHWLHIVSALVLFVTMSAIPAIIYYFSAEQFLFMLDNPISYVILIMLAGIYYLSILLITYSTLLDHILDVWAVTNYRIIAIEQRGLFNRAFAEHLIERIQDVGSVKKGMLQTFLNFGDVEIQTAGEQKQYIFNDVSDPEKIVQTINELLGQRLQRNQNQENFRSEL